MKRAGALALCLYAGSALADARLEARRHFRTGMSLIAQGQYEAGIAELKEAYAIKPHPSVLYNMARAYQTLGRTAEALEGYRGYLAYNPPDAGEVQATVARLEAEMAANIAPPVVVPPPVGKPPPGAGTVDTQALGALLERLEKAVARAESIPATPAAPAPASATPQPGLEATEATEAASRSDSEDVPYEEQVVTASRRAQSSLESPNATTVITAEDIRLSGATSLPELLRRVPGADVMVMGVGSANVSLRGFNQRLANKVLVLVDGRTEYQDFLGGTLWSGIPAELDEIERIEVIRGPGSALYGANAMLGVINIITRAPGTGPRARMQLTAGGGNTLRGSLVSHGGSGALRYRTSVAYSQADRWSRDFDNGRPDVAVRAPDPNVALRSVRGQAAFTYSLGKLGALGLTGGVDRYTTELYPLGLLRNYFLDGYSAHTKADAALGPVKLKAVWNHLSVGAGPMYEAVGQRSLGTHVVSHLLSGEALFSKSFTLLGEHQVNVGVEGRFKSLDWSYLGGPHEQLHAAAFAQDEWQVLQPLRLVASYRVDRHPLLDEGKPGLAHSPRLSVLYRPFEGHVFRASAASAFREPTFLESYTELRIPLPGINGASALTTGNRALKPESLVALEVGWRGEAPILGLDWDVAVYQNTVRNLIGLSSLQRLPAGESWDSVSNSFLLGRSTFQNEPAVYTARGAEAGVNLSPLDGLGVKLSAAWQQVTAEGEAASECAPCGQVPQLKLYGGLTWRSRADLEFGVDGTWTSQTTWIEREPAATDPTRIELVSNPLPAYAVINARVGYEAVKDKLMVAVQGSHLADAHFQHPFGNRIERRIFATVTVTP